MAPPAAIASTAGLGETSSATRTGQIPSASTCRQAGRRASGARGESDRLRSIEDASGGEGNDVIVGDDGPNRIDIGTGGSDLLVGLGGNDRFVATPSTTVLAGRGNDRIEAVYIAGVRNRLGR